MDLTRLPISLSKVRSADKAGIEKDRKQFWDRLFEKYERLSEMETEEETIDQIDQPISVLKREKTYRSLCRDVPGSKTFRKWVADHGEEIDELTTIAGPLGEDEEEIGEDEDMENDMSSDSEEDEAYKTDYRQNDGDPLCDENPHQNQTEHVGDDELISEDSDSDLGFLQSSLPRQLRISQSMTPIKKNHSFVEKFRNSPKLASSFNNSLLTPRKSEMSMNLSCLSCGTKTDYSVDMGVSEKQFECDDCLLSVHPDCMEECKLCKNVAQEVESRWIKKRNFHEQSINLAS